MKAHPRRRPARCLRGSGTERWLLLAETLAVIAVASAAIRLVPFRRLVRVASLGPLAGNRPGMRGAGVDELRWAVEAVSRRVPWRVVCFQKGLALHLMLRRRGTPSLLHYGVGKDKEGELAAHVWISVEGEIVMGGQVGGRFTCLATYPAGSSASAPVA